MRLRTFVFSGSRCRCGSPRCRYIREAPRSRRVFTFDELPKLAASLTPMRDQYEQQERRA
jgi:hypothetical protein